MELDDLISQIGSMVFRLLQTKRNPVMIAVCGGTSCCKSTLVVQQIKEKIGNELVDIIELDNFQKGREWKPILKGKYGHDTPEYFEVNESIQCIKALKDNQVAAIPVYDYSLGKQTGTTIIKPKAVVIYEGLYAAYVELATISDIVVYVESPLYARMLRRMFRNRYERYQVDPKVSFSSFLHTINAHIDLIAPQKNHAHFILNIPYRFEDSIQRFGLKPMYATGKQVDLIVEHGISENTQLGVHFKNGHYFFTLFHLGKMYLDFEISEEQYAKFVRLDFEGV